MPRDARPGPAGVLVVDKPPGPTSHDIVAVARRALGTARIGHTGTLDPMATGVLALMVGAATRLAPYFGGDPKSYDATVAFGRATDTYDATGTEVSSSPARPSREDVDAALARFRGTFEQTPPAYSAKLIDGTRAYTMARQAKGAPAPRPKAVAVTVERLELRDFDGERVRLAMRVSAGFYVRTLAHDLGEVLGMGAVLEELRRTQAGDFGLDEAVSLDALQPANREALGVRLVPLNALLPDLPAVRISQVGVAWARQGRPLSPAELVGPMPGPPPPLVRLLDGSGRIVGLGRPGGGPGLLHAFVVLG